MESLAKRLQMRVISQISQKMQIDFFWRILKNIVIFEKFFAEFLKNTIDGNFY